jgi:hypothetical protein
LALAALCSASPLWGQDTAPEDEIGPLDAKVNRLEQSVDRLRKLLDQDSMESEIALFLKDDRSRRTEVQALLRALRQEWFQEGGDSLRDALDQLKGRLNSEEEKEISEWLSHRRNRAAECSTEIEEASQSLADTTHSLSQAISIWSGGQAAEMAKQAHDLQEFGEAYGEKWVDWSEQYQEHWQDWAEGQEKVWSQRAEEQAGHWIKKGPGLERKWLEWTANQEGQLEDWAQLQETKWEEWAEDYSARWEEWGERYGQGWRDWAKQIEDLENGSKEVSVGEIGKIVEGFFRNFDPLEEMPLDALYEMPALDLEDMLLDEEDVRALGAIARLSDSDLSELRALDEIQDHVEQLVEQALSGLEDLPSEDPQLPTAIQEYVDQVTQASRHLRLALQGKRHHLGQKSSLQWKILEEVLRQEPDESTSLVKRLKDERSELDRKEEQLRDLQEEIRQLQEKVQRLESKEGRRRAR